MEKNYYEILEVDKHASSDIIKKAYTTLAKNIILIYNQMIKKKMQKKSCKKLMKLMKHCLMKN